MCAINQRKILELVIIPRHQKSSTGAHYPQFIGIAMQDGGSALEAAASWGAGAITGMMATSVAVLAVGFSGFAMLRGMIAWRDAFRIVLGCFILFGSSAIAKGLMGEVWNSREIVAIRPAQEPHLTVEKLRSPPPSQGAGDPFNPYSARVER